MVFVQLGYVDNTTRGAFRHLHQGDAVVGNAHGLLQPLEMAKPAASSLAPLMRRPVDSCSIALELARSARARERCASRALVLLLMAVMGCWVWQGFAAVATQGGSSWLGCGRGSCAARRGSWVSSPWVLWPCRVRHVPKSGGGFPTVSGVVRRRPQCRTSPPAAPVQGVLRGRSGLVHTWLRAFGGDARDCVRAQETKLPVGQARNDPKLFGSV